MNDDAIYWGIMIVCLVISTPTAFAMNDSLHKKYPELKPYTWGYYVGWMGMLGWSAIGILQLIAASNAYGGRSGTLVVLGVVSLVAAIAHFFIIRRNKWAWVIGIILQLNPVLWIINGIYLKNRWTEMGGLPAGEVGNKFKNASFSTRVLLAGSGFWALVVLAFVFMFEPYGSYVSNSEWWQVVKIVVFPPVVMVAGYFLYSKVIKQESQQSE